MNIWITGAQPQEVKVFQLSSAPALIALFAKVILQIILKFLSPIFMGPFLQNQQSVFKLLGSYGDMFCSHG